MSISREFPDRPVVAVGAVVVTDDGTVVLVRRGQPPLEGRWSLPGGALEIGESLVEGVAREVQEETGLVVEVGPRIEVIEHVTRDEAGRVAFHYVIVDFLCRVTGGCLCAGTDAIEVALAAPADLGAFRLTAAAQSVIAAAQRMAPNPSREPNPNSGELV